MLTQLVVLARGGFWLPDGSERTISLRLTRRGRMLLAHARGHRLRVRASATLTAGPTISRTIILYRLRR